jgi:uncharacterized protein
MDVALVLTHDCNLGCPYCYAGEKFGRAMSAEVAERALSFVELDAPKDVQVSFFGGEPLLRFDLLREYTLLARDRLTKEGRPLRFVATTNGTCFTEDRLAFLREQGFFLGLSIDGVKEAHDAGRRFVNGKSSFDAVLRGLRLLMASGIDFETISVVDPTNVRWLGETVRFLIGEGVRRIALNPNFDADWDDEALAAWERGYKEVGEAYKAAFRRGHLVYVNVIDDKVISHLKGGYKLSDHCAFGRRAIAVAPSGNIYPCERMVGEDRDATYRIGNVLEGFSPRRRTLIETAGNHNGDCSGCALLERCMSFCACANLADTGCHNVPGGLLCWHEQTAIDVADNVAAALYGECNPMFLQHYYLR